ncbi:MAG: serine hydrolase domain-containing protein, partial [Gemmatimonadota bacterium]|nr:serine hydrolase domain-containing protein [Gemmatimonadota bacterium]
MVRRALLTFLLVGIVSFTEAPAFAQGSSTIDPASELDRFVERAMAELDVVPGMAVAIVRGDSVLLARGYGWADLENRRPVTPATVFYIASSVKALTGILAAELAQVGKLDLDAPVGRYLPGFDLPAPLDPGSVTLRGLLTHTSGMTDSGLNWRTTWVDAPPIGEVLAHVARWGESRSG